MYKIYRYMLLLGMLFLMTCIFVFDVAWAEGEPEESELYAKSAVLMDASSGRVLYEKNGSESLPMASTTKIMTCILALEKGDPEDLVTISAYAASQPKVRLGVKEGEQYRLKDLLYSLMLESHNDSAVAIAEHIGGSVEGFAKLMNAKAAELGCEDTYFITPNGLDAAVTIAEGDGKARVEEHRTSAIDLARIMSYCIQSSGQRERFLEITQKPEYRFCNQVAAKKSSVTSDGTHHVSCTNHNAFLNMMEGVLSGKTGYTSRAGYCYVGALEDEGRVFTVALLACGWPNHKSYKWSDTRTLMEYGEENYHYRFLTEEGDTKAQLAPVIVRNGQTDRIGTKAYMPLKCQVTEGDSDRKRLLMRKDEAVEVIYAVPKELRAPVLSGSKIGSIKYLAAGEVWRTEVITAAKTVYEIDYRWCLAKIVAIFLT